jgi:hypothetical protein
MRLLLAARGGVRPDAYALGLTMATVRDIAEAHGATCHGVGCSTCAELVQLLSLNDAYVADNIPNLPEIIERVRRGEAPPPVAMSTTDLVQTIMATDYRFFEVAATALTAIGIVAGVIIGLGGHPVVNAVFGVGCVAAVPVVYRWVFRRLRTRLP